MYDELVKRLREADEKSMCGECGLNLHTGATKKGVLFAEAADAIEELSKPKWIPVTERLPKEEETVLAFGTLGVAWLDWRHDNKWCCYGGVTHWIPLPTPPQAEDGE